MRPSRHGSLGTDHELQRGTSKLMSQVLPEPMIATTPTPPCVVEADACSSEQWREIARRFSDYSIYQACAYADARAADVGATNQRVVVRRGTEVMGLAQVRIKRLPVVRTGVAYIYRGPLWRRPGAGPEDFGAVLAALRAEYGVRLGLEVRVACGMIDEALAGDCRDAIRHAGFSPRSQERIDRTILLDLSPDADALRKALAQKWRNGLNQSERRDLTVETRTDGDAMKIFQSLYEQMWAAKQFETGVSVASFAHIQTLLPEDEKLTIALAFHDGTPVAGHVSTCLGDTCVYLLGASSDDGRKRKASYLLQWRTIEDAKSRGARLYDLGGIDPEANPGVYHFKSGMGGRACDFPGTFAAPARGSGRILVPLAEKAYRILGARRSRGSGT